LIWGKYLELEKILGKEAIMQSRVINNVKNLFIIILLVISTFFLIEVSTAEIVTKDYLIDSIDAGIQLHMREKFMANVGKVPGEKIVLFVHGATYSSVPGFDIPLPGYSWMDYLAQRGYVAYCLDIRGYGGSTRPPEMDQPPSANPPIVRAEVAIKDITAAVEYIRKKHEVDKINLLGWSWGTVTTGMYTSRHNEKVNKLILFAPVYSVKHPAAQRFEDPVNPGQPNLKIGAYRFTKAEDAVKRWLTSVKSADWIDPQARETWVKLILESDPTSWQRTPPSLRSPNGVLVDIYYIFTERPIYEASQIKVPVLILRGDADTESLDADARGLFQKLTSAPYKRYVLIGDGTHFINAEKNRWQLFQESLLFLDSKP